jgi:hypothetical protein
MTRASKMPGSIHGASIKNPDTYEALKREGYSKSSAAAISNDALNKGYKKGVHHAHKGKHKKKSAGRKLWYNPTTRA